MDKIAYVKYSNERADEFSIKTSLMIGENDKYIIKEVANNKAQKHIDNLCNIKTKLTEQYCNNICINECVRQDVGVRFEFIMGKTFEDLLDEKMQKQDYLGVIDGIKLYREKVIDSIPKQDFVITEEFTKVFGEVCFSVPQKSLKISDIDMIFSNIIVCGDVWNVIDYEWTFDFPIPVDFILYRAIVNYLYSSNKRDCLWHLQMEKLFGISDEQIEMFKSMEQAFQKYVSGNKNTMSDFCRLFNREKYNVVDYIKDYVPGRLQVFYDYGDGYTEENSELINCECVDNRYVLNIKVQEGVKEVRVDPINTYCIMKIYGLDYVLNDGESDKDIYTLNGFQFQKNVYLFNTDDPQIIINSNKIKSFRLEYAISELSSQFAKVVLPEIISEKSVLELIDEINGLQNTNENQALELEKRMNLINELRAENDIKGNEIKLAQEELDRRGVELEKRMNLINELRAENDIKGNEIKLVQEELDRRGVELEKRMDLINELREKSNDMSKENGRLSNELREVKSRSIIKRIINKQ